MFEALGLIVNAVPLHAEDLAEHALDEVMALGEFAGDLATGGSEADAAIGVDAHETIFLEAAQGHGDCGRRDFEPVGERGGDDGFAFAFGLENGLEVILFGDGDHVMGIIRRELSGVNVTGGEFRPKVRGSDCRGSRLSL